MNNILVIFYFMFSSLNFLNGQLFNNHEYFIKEFRKSSSKKLLLGRTTAIETKWITQPLDHFNAADQRNWTMRYFQNMEKWRQGGPVFIDIGGEGESNSIGISDGLLYDLATETNGAMFATEHRYYGESQPFQSATRTDIKYCTSRQALADLAYFIRSLKRSKALSKSKVVVIGGSYAGNLAAWMRLLYPELVDAAIASSAPVLAKLNFYEYYETVGNNFKKYATAECFDEIVRKFKTLKSAFKTKSGIEEIKAMYNIYYETDMTKRDNQASFFMARLQPFCIASQYGTPRKISNYCDETYNIPYDTTLDRDENYEDFNITNIGSKDDLYHFWFYQTCNEFGYFTTSPFNQPFSGIPIDVNYWVRLCKAKFGPEFTKASIQSRIDRTNLIYGGRTPNVTNVIFSHGEIDPWRTLGVLQDLSDTAPVFMISGASHCMDLMHAQTRNVLKVQQDEKRLIKKWIGL